MTHEPPRRVRFLQSGGIAGAVRACELDRATMAPDDARELADLVHASGITSSGEFRTPDARDLRLYEIHLELDVRTISVTFDDQTVPEQVRPLLSFLRRCAKPRPLE